MIASMTIPWGFAAKADSAEVGGYHLVGGLGTFMRWQPG